MSPADDHPFDSERIKAALNGRSLIFVGMMGSGKTAIGRLVAAALKIPFYDSDQEIVTAANLDISEIFERHGEEYFRAGEERVIQRLLAGESAVISLGGGAFLSENTRKQIRETAIAIWLKADLDLLLSRVMRRPGTRPLLRTDNPEKTLAELMEKREPFYALADIHVTSSRTSKAKTRETVLAAIADYLDVTPTEASKSDDSV